MALRKIYFFLFSFFIFLFWVRAVKELNAEKLNDITKCGEEPGEDCFKDSCYTFHTNVQTWNNSKTECERIGSNLVSLETEEEVDYLQNRISKFHKFPRADWYIGLSVETPLWQWVSGKPLTYDHWGKDKPESSKKNKAVIVANSSLFSDVLYRAIRPAICEFGQRKYGELCYQQSCYTFELRPKRWDVYKHECRKIHGDLVSLETEGEWSHISNIIKTKSKREWHIGLEGKPVKSWKWINDASFSLRNDLWKLENPRGRTHFAFMDVGTDAWFKDPKKRYIFGDADNVSDEKQYICERKLVYRPPQ